MKLIDISLLLLCDCYQAALFQRVYCKAATSTPHSWNLPKQIKCSQSHNACAQSMGLDYETTRAMSSWLLQSYDVILNLVDITSSGYQDDIELIFTWYNLDIKNDIKRYLDDIAHESKPGWRETGCRVGITERPHLRNLQKRSSVTSADIFYLWSDETPVFESFRAGKSLSIRLITAHKLPSGHKGRRNKTKPSSVAFIVERRD